MRCCICLIIVIPLSGWLYSSATGVPTVYLGLLQLPDLLARDKALAEVLKYVHLALNYSHAGAGRSAMRAPPETPFCRSRRRARAMLPFSKLCTGKTNDARPIMPTTIAKLLALAAGAVLFAGTAAAQTVIYEKSRITCVSRQENVPVEAQFRKFTAQIVFDPARAETSKAQIEIDVASFDIDNAEVNDEVRGKQWFDARSFPKATFVSSAIRALGGGRFEARGPLTIKGKTIEVVTPFTWRAEAGGGVIEGAFSVKRLQYNIGEGVWKDTETVADEVQIRYRLALGPARTAAPAKK